MRQPFGHRSKFDYSPCTFQNLQKFDAYQMHLILTFTKRGTSSLPGRRHATLRKLIKNMKSKYTLTKQPQLYVIKVKNCCVCDLIRLKLSLDHNLWQKKVTSKHCSCGFKGAHNQLKTVLSTKCPYSYLKRWFVASINTIWQISLFPLVHRNYVNLAATAAGVVWSNCSNMGSIRWQRSADKN